MITGRWGKPSEVLLDLAVEEDGTVRGRLDPGRRLMAEAAREFLARGIHSCIHFAELSNPTLGFYDRMGGERLPDDRGQFSGAYGWRDVRTLLG